MVYRGPVKRPGCCPVVTTSTSPAASRSRPVPGSTAARTSALTGRGARVRGCAPPDSGVATIRGITLARAPSFAEHIRWKYEHLGLRFPPYVRPEAGLAAGGRQK